MNPYILLGLIIVVAIILSIICIKFLGCLGIILTFMLVLGAPTAWILIIDN